jgi:hypothetical protein
MSDRALTPCSRIHLAFPGSSLDLSVGFSRLSAKISQRTLASSCANTLALQHKAATRATEPRSASWFWELSGRTDGLGLSRRTSLNAPTRQRRFDNVPSISAYSAWARLQLD